MAYTDTTAFDRYRERANTRRDTEKRFTITEGGQKGSLEYEADPGRLAELEQARKARHEKNLAAITEQKEHVDENYYGVHDQLNELSSGAIVVGENGIQRVEWEKPEVPEADQLRADYERYRKQDNSAGMARTKSRLAAVEAAERDTLRQIELQRGVTQAEFELSADLEYAPLEEEDTQEDDADDWTEEDE